MRRTSICKFSAVLAVIILMSVVAVCFSSCNKQLFDTSYNFKYAYVCWPDGRSEKLSIKSWNDYDGEQIQIKTINGNVYVFHSANCVLASE